MGENMKKYAVLAGMVLVVLSVAPAWAADMIYLKSGRVVEGRIFRRTREEVAVMVNGEPERFFREQIERIETEEDQQKKALGPEGVAQEKRELIIRFLEANGTRDSLARTFSQILAAIPEAERAKYNNLLKIDEVIDKILPIYDQNYTEDELKELIRFYKSPAGQKNLELTPKIVVESMEAVAAYFREKTGVSIDEGGG